MDICIGTLEGEFDVVVVGSGAAGLTAALSAQEWGARVAVIEKSSVLGGTTALSGGMLWIPMSRSARERNFEDSFDRAMAYARVITMGRAQDEMLEAHLRRGPEMLEFIESCGGPRYNLVGSFPDYHPELAGGNTGGRSVEPDLYDLSSLGELSRYVRDDPRPPFTQQEYFEVFKTYKNFPPKLFAERRKKGVVTRGRALIAGLLKAVADRQATIVASDRVQRLITSGGRVVGISHEGGELYARRAVVLASGGFEWSDELCTRLLSGPVWSRCGAPTNEGDGLKMAMAVGCDIANTNEAWWAIHTNLPGLEAEGKALGTVITVERALPGSIVVNPAGERFVNEASSYYTFGKVLANFDARRYGYRNLPAHLVADNRFLKTYGILGLDSAEQAPFWMNSAPTLEELAIKIGVDPQGLVTTVARFNSMAEAGKDTDYCRGESAYDRYFGDSNAPHSNLAPLLEPPFVAIEICCGAIGTKGGVRTDVDARALDPWGLPVEGLYAVGNVSAHPIAFGYLGAGSTLGPAMTMAYAAGRAAMTIAGSADYLASPA